MKSASQEFSWEAGFAVLVSYLVAIHLGPRLGNGLRIEDYITPLLFVAVTVCPRRAAARTFAISLIYFAWSFLVTAISISTNYLPFEAALIWGKEAQYFLGAFLLAMLFWDRPERLRRLNWPILALATFACGFAIYSILTLKAGYYGLGYLNEMDSPSLNAWIYFNLLVLTMISGRYLGANPQLVTLLSVMLFAATLLTGSRTGQLISFAFLVTNALLERPSKGILWGLVSIAVIVVLRAYQQEIFEALLTLHPPTANAFFRLTTLFTFAETLEGSRGASWRYTIERWQRGNLVFGCGRGCTNLMLPGVMYGLTMGGDNQYTRNLEEIGILGNALFAATLLSLRQFMGDPYRRLYTAYLGAYLLGGMTMEAWQLSKPGQLFWIITALLLSISNGRIKEIR